MPRRVRLLAAVREDGFLLTETVVAMGLGVLLLTVLTAGLASGLRATSETKRFQQATALGTQAVERAKEAPYDALVMVASELNGDPRVGTNGCGTGELRPPGFHLCERLVIDATTGAGAIHPHRTTETIGGLDFSVWRYLTWARAPDSGEEETMKRITAIVEWEAGEASRSFHISGTITNVPRGLQAALIGPYGNRWIDTPNFDVRSVSPDMDMVTAGGPISAGAEGTEPSEPPAGSQGLQLPDLPGSIDVSELLQPSPEVLEALRSPSTGLDQIVSWVTNAHPAWIVVPVSLAAASLAARKS